MTDNAKLRKHSDYKMSNLALANLQFGNLKGVKVSNQAAVKLFGMQCSGGGGSQVV